MDRDANVIPKKSQTADRLGKCVLAVKGDDSDLELHPVDVIGQPRSRRLTFLVGKPTELLVLEVPSLGYGTGANASRPTAMSMVRAPEAGQTTTAGLPSETLLRIGVDHHVLRRLPW